jgi:hypothetical protein
MKQGLWLLVLLPVLAFGQGQIVFNNSAATGITNHCTGQRASTQTRVGFYVNANTNATTGSFGWHIAGGWTNLYQPGIFLGGIRTLGGFPAGTQVAVQLRAWLSTVPFEDYETALIGWTGVGGFGHSIVMIITPAAPPAPIPVITANGLQPFTIGTLSCIPEPSVCALLLLGIWAVLLIRRRNCPALPDSEGSSPCRTTGEQA